MYAIQPLRRGIACMAGLCLLLTLATSCQHGRAKKSDGMPLFNGRDLSGWETPGNATWKVEDGCIVGTQGPDNAPGDLLTARDYDDFELKVVFKMTWPGNSGVWFRYQSDEQAYQADILEYKNPVCYAGSLYCTGKMFLALNEDPNIVNRESWNTCTIRAEGDHITVTLNGTVTADVHDDTSSHGRIGFQIHAGDQFKDMKIEIREIRIRPLH